MCPLSKTLWSLPKPHSLWLELANLALSQKPQSSVPTDSNKGLCPRPYLSLCLDMKSQCSFPKPVGEVLTENTVRFREYWDVIVDEIKMKGWMKIEMCEWTLCEVFASPLSECIIGMSLTADLLSNLVLENRRHGSLPFGQY